MRRDLPFFLGLMEHLAEHGVTCPTPVRDPTAATLRQLAGRPAALVTFLEGFWLRRPRPPIAPRSDGRWRELHLGRRRASRLRRANALGLPGWRPLYRALRVARRRGRAGPAAAHRAASSTHLEANWPRDCRRASSTPISSPTTCSSSATLSGLIDFYFACNDALAYDIAVCLNAWCFEPDSRSTSPRARRCCAGYEDVRPLTPAEREAMPMLARGRGAALPADARSTTG